MKTDIYLNSTKESNYNKGKELGLKGKALDYFLHALCEVEITVDVNENTGEATIIKVDGKELKDIENIKGKTEE